MPYSSRKIQRIRAFTHQRPQRKEDQYAVSGRSQYTILKIRHFKTLSLDELRTPDFNLPFDQEYSEEEEVEIMAETMEHYMSKTRANYRSGVARPKIEDNDNFELKCQFLKELQINTFSGADHEDANEHIEKVLEIVDLFHIPNITIDQVMLRAFPMSLTGAASRWLRNEPTGSITTWDGLKTKFLNKYCPPARTAKKMEVILFYNRLGIPTRQILDSRGAIPSKIIADTKIAIQEMAEYSQKWHNGTSLSRTYSETSQSIPQKEKDPGSFTLPCFITNVFFDNALVDLGDSVSVMPLSTYLNLGLGELAHTKLTVELADMTVKYLKGIAENEDYIELNDLNKPFKLRRNQGDDLMPTIEEGEVIEEFRTRDDELNVGIDDYPSYCDYDKKIHIDFLENMDDYRDEGMGDVIFGEPFLREVGIKAKTFEGIITNIYNGDDEVTYQMVRSHPRFKCHTNEQCNKIPPLLNVSKEDKMNGISHPYQKLKGFNN
ncbi:gag-pol polyprotein [Tanacetum coccineum]